MMDLAKLVALFLGPILNIMKVTLIELILIVQVFQFHMMLTFLILNVFIIRNLYVLLIRAVLKKEKKYTFAISVGFLKNVLIMMSMMKKLYLLLKQIVK